MPPPPGGSPAVPSGRPAGRRNRGTPERAGRRLAETGRPAARWPPRRRRATGTGRRRGLIWRDTQPIGRKSSVFLFLFLLRCLLGPNRVTVVDLVVAGEDDLLLRIDIAFDHAVPAHRPDDVDVDALGVALVDLINESAPRIGADGIARHHPALELADLDTGLEVLAGERHPVRNL